MSDEIVQPAVHTPDQAECRVYPRCDDLQHVFIIARDGYEKFSYIACVQRKQNRAEARDHHNLSASCGFEDRVFRNEPVFRK